MRKSAKTVQARPIVRRRGFMRRGFEGVISPRVNVSDLLSGNIACEAVQTQTLNPSWIGGWICLST